MEAEGRTLTSGHPRYVFSRWWFEGLFVAWNVLVLVGTVLALIISSAFPAPLGAIAALSIVILFWASALAAAFERRNHASGLGRRHQSH